MRVTATAKYVRISPRKVRLVTDLIVGRPVEEAAAILRFLPNAAARDVAKVLRSATANAENNFNLTRPTSCTWSPPSPNEGPTLKRIRPRAQGRAFQILKRTSHITVVGGRPRRQPDGPQGSPVRLSGSASTSHGWRSGTPIVTTPPCSRRT